MVAAPVSPKIRLSLIRICDATAPNNNAEGIEQRVEIVAAITTAVEANKGPVGHISTLDRKKLRIATAVHDPIQNNSNATILLAGRDFASIAVIFCTLHYIHRR
jgi:hypothetical protein